MAEFRRAARAITRAGQVKGSGGRHEKNDATRIDDRSSYVLGWTNQRKIDALLTRARTIAQQQSEVTAAEQAAAAAHEAVIDRGRLLAGLAETTDFAEIDWQLLVNRIGQLTADKRRIEESSGELERLSRLLVQVAAQIQAAQADVDGLGKSVGGLETEVSLTSVALAGARDVLADPGAAEAESCFDAIGQLLTVAPLDSIALTAPSDCDRAEAAAARDLTATIDRRAGRQQQAGNKIVARMADFRRQYPAQTAELDDSVLSADGYRELHRRLASDDLPRFQARFKEYLNTNTIREVAGFQAQLSKQAELIRERVATINASLADVEYNPGRYIRLDAHATPNTDVRDFRTDLRACTDDVLSGDLSDKYSEAKFAQVSALIERFKGREGLTEADRAWTRRVTDVRNWFVFAASERWREDDSEYENYTDSGGKSGGQKEKLAYTILAASLAYQFKLEWGAARSRTFRFVVIDEAFGRGSDESTRFALKLFDRLGLQLLIVTPLQKIHVIEPHVAAVGFVDNPSNNCSRLQTLTIEEYRARQVAHALAGAVQAAETAPANG